jgi:hypothetical protein
MTARDAMADPPKVERRARPPAPTRASTGPDVPEEATGVPGAPRAPGRPPAILLVPLGVTVVIVAALFGALPTVSLGTHSRYLCKRLRARYPDLRIIVGRWGGTEDIEEVRSLLLAAGADQVTTALTETRHQIELLASEPGGRLAANG